LDRSGISDSDLIRWADIDLIKLRILADVGHVAANDLTWPYKARMHAQGEHALLQRLSQKSHIRKGKCMMLYCMQPERATTADVGLVRTGVPNGWESPLQDNSNASKVGKDFSLCGS
jgi:hypothetical protein